MKQDIESRRHFLRQVGKGMLVASVGAAVAREIGISAAFAAEAEPGRLSFGKLDPLVGLLQETPIEALQPLLVGKLKRGEVDLPKLVQAAALSNARSFGGEDYVGMHTLMALKPAYLMARRLPEGRSALPVLKVLYRNSEQIGRKGGRAKELLRPVAPAEIGADASSLEMLRDAVHRQDKPAAEAVLARATGDSPDKAFNELLQVVAEDASVHRVVFAHRSWDILDLVGMEHAEAMLRQSLRFTINGEKWRQKGNPELAAFLPKLLDEFKLPRASAETRAVDDAWVEAMSRAIFEGTPEDSARAVAAALSEGIAPATIGEAIALAGNQLVLRDRGRRANEVRPGKPEGSVHGDSIGVHASDSAHAWRSMAEVSSARNAAACLILGAWQVARDRTNRGGSFLEWQPRPHEEQLAKVKAREPDQLLRELDGVIREQDQAMACALVHRYGELGHEPRGVVDLLLRYATSEDGALHAEKYFLTTTSDFAATRPAFRWRHLTGLARVTASEYGKRAPGHAQACELLGVEVG